jgi:hypothetical protein
MFITIGTKIFKNKTPRFCTPMKITKSPKQTPEIGDLCVTTKKCILKWFPGARRTQQVEQGTLVLIVGFHPKYDASYLHL